MPKKCVVIYVEGPTDEEFYNKLKENIKNKISDKRFKVDALKVVCIKGIGKYSSKLLCKFKCEIVDKYSDYDKIVFLCYDNDVFEYGVYPPIDRKKLEEDLYTAGATNVFHIAADRTIEDYFMIDEQGVLQYLKLKSNTKIKGSNGLEKINNLFKSANRTYQKGSMVSGLVDSLNIDLICSKICSQLSTLCTLLGLECSLKCVSKTEKSNKKKEKGS